MIVAGGFDIHGGLPADAAVWDDAPFGVQWNSIACRNNLAGEAWLGAIARYKWIDHLRALKRSQTTALAGEVSVSGSTTARAVARF